MDQSKHHLFGIRQQCHGGSKLLDRQTQNVTARVFHQIATGRIVVEGVVILPSAAETRQSLAFRALVGAHRIDCVVTRTWCFWLRQLPIFNTWLAHAANDDVSLRPLIHESVFNLVYEGWRIVASEVCSHIVENSTAALQHPLVNQLGSTSAQDCAVEWVEPAGVFPCFGWRSFER